MENYLFRFLILISEFSKFSWAQLPPQDKENIKSSYHLYALRIKGINEQKRDAIIDEISKLGVAVNVHFIPMPMLTLFKNLGYKMEDHPIAYDNYSREISLPIYPQLCATKVGFVIQAVIDSYSKVMNND